MVLVLVFGKRLGLLPLRLLLGLLVPLLRLLLLLALLVELVEPQLVVLVLEPQLRLVLVEPEVLLGRFDDRATRPQRGPGDMLKWKVFDRLAGKGGRRPRDGFRTPARAPDLELVKSAAGSVTWIGHATFLMRLGGRVIATDPVWSERLSGVVGRVVAPGAALEDVPAIDVVTVSHNHLDHLDLPTLRRIGPDALYVVPLGNARLLRGAGLPRVVELDWWETHREDGLDITLVPARHWSMRTPWDRNDALWGGFVVRGAEGTAYHSGDTAYFDGFREIRRRLGAIDWAMLPIGAYEPRWFMESQHMNPEDAGQAFEDLGARHFLAMHWGTFLLTDEPSGEPPRRTRDVFATRGIDPARLWIFDVGETRGLREP